MRHELALRRARWQKVSDVLSEHAGISELPDVGPQVKSWAPRIDAWDKLQASAASAGRGGFGDPKNEAKLKAAELLSRAGRRCSLQAHTLGLYSVEHIIDRRAYELAELKDADARKEMDAIRNALYENKAAFSAQGLNEVKIAEIDEAIAAYVNLSAKASSARNAQSALLRQVDEMTTALDEEMASIIYLLEAEYEDSDAAFVASLLAAAHLGKSTGRRNTGMQGSVRHADGSFAVGYKLRCNELNKEAVTDLAGAYSIPRMKSGLHKYELFDAADKKMDEAVIRMQNGTTIVKDWLVGGM